MRLLFSDVLVTDENHENHAKHVNIAVIGNTVEYVGEARPEGEFDRVISGNYLVMPGFYNAHCHSAMTLFRGLGGDLPLKHWLDEAILPAEDRLTPELVRLFSTEAIAEMIACGTVAFSDMYFLCTDTARAALDSGIKLNIARSVVSFDEDADPRSRLPRCGSAGALPRVERRGRRQDKGRFFAPRRIYEHSADVRISRRPCA